MKRLIFVFSLIMLLSACKVGRFFIYNFADINDHKKFQNRSIEKAEKSFQFEKAKKPIAPRVIGTKKEKDIPFAEFLEQNKTVAFLIIYKDSIHFEGYYNRYEQEDIVNSFSMAKSVCSMLIGFAIQDGLINSVDEPVTNYIPELSEAGFDQVSILHLLQMTSGLKFNESYTNPFGHAATFYYGRNLRKAVKKSKLEHEPGTHFDYQSGSTQILGYILDVVLQKEGKTISQYLEEKLWKPLEMEYDASWSLDRKKNGLEKTFCCLNARARDFAKIGKFMMQKGNWNGEQLLDSNWVNQSLAIDTSMGSTSYYQYQWWLLNSEPDYMAQGILGQFIYVHPKKELIMVRLGKNYGDYGWPGIFQSLSKLYE